MGSTTTQTQYWIIPFVFQTLGCVNYGHVHINKQRQRAYRVPWSNFKPTLEFGKCQLNYDISFVPLGTKCFKSSVGGESTWNFQ